MVIDEKKLRELVIRAIELIQAENSLKLVSSKKKLYVIFTEEWNGRYWSFFENLKEEDEYEVYAVIPSVINTMVLLNNLKKFKVFKEIVDEKDINFEQLYEYVTVFPIVPRDVIVKTALCIEDTFETKWIFKSIENGQRIIFLKSGLQKFSGKEPLSYRNKILEYYRTLLEFDIEITDFIIKKENNIPLKESKSISQLKYTQNYNKSLNEKKSQHIKKLITEKEVESYAENNQIILNNGDIITDLAKDKANSLNIRIIRR